MACEAMKKIVLSRRRRVLKTCRKCGSDFETHAFRAETAHYCSRACWSNRAPTATCQRCGSAFKVIAGDREKFCSKSCYSSTLGREGHPSWKGGASLENDRARLSPQLREWRKQVFQRDDFTCRQCGGRGSLHAHHVKAFADHPDLRLDLDNGLTLCVSCHGAIHGKDFSRRPSGVGRRRSKAPPSPPGLPSPP